MGMRWQRQAWHEGRKVARISNNKRKVNFDVDVVVASTNSGRDMAVGLDLKVIDDRVQGYYPIRS